MRDVMVTPQLVVGLLVYAGAMFWILADWRVRTLRAFLLLILSLATAVVVAGLNDGALGYVGGAIVGGLIALPVLLHHWTVSALRPTDSAMVRQLANIERRLVAAGQELRDRQIDVADYRQRLALIRDQVADLDAPDVEWEGVIRSMRDDIGRSLSFSAGEGSETADYLRRRRKFVSNETQNLLRRRRSWI
jgi:hypothetical protein